MADKYNTEVERTEEGGNVFHIIGEVHNDEGKLLPGLRVQAVYNSSHYQILVGEDITNKQGRYSITYSVSKFTEENRTLDLLICVFNSKGDLLEKSPVKISAKMDEETNIIISSTKKVIPSEHTHMADKHNPLLEFKPVDQFINRDNHPLFEQTDKMEQIGN